MRGFVILLKSEHRASIDHTAGDLINLKLNQLTCYIPRPLLLSLPPPPPPHRSSTRPLLPLLIAIMPSLRRTSSHPSLRSSPYGPTQRTQHPYPHRRSSAPETTRRRVLADIDWWTVSDGQVPAATELQTRPATPAGQEQDENVHLEPPVLERTRPESPNLEDVEEPILRGDSPVVHTTISVSSCQPIVGGSHLVSSTCSVQFSDRGLRRALSCPPSSSSRYEEAHSAYIRLPHLGYFAVHRL